MTPVGTIAGGVTATIDDRGTVAPAGARWTLGWWVGAEDRWHRAEREVAVRQRLVDDTPVVETAMRVPSGDVVERVFGARSGGDDVVVVELENQSPVPVALALFLAGAKRIAVDDALVTVDRRPALWCPKPPARAASAREVELLASIVTSGGAADSLAPVKRGAVAFVWPLAHRTTLRFVLGPSAPSSLPTAEQVVNGWRVQSDRGVRIVVPDAALQATIEAGRRFALLTQDDALVLARYGYRDEAVAVAERVAPAVAATADRMARSKAPDRQALLDAAEVLAMAGEEQAASVARHAARGVDGAAPVASRSPLLDVRDQLVRETDDGVALCSVVPDDWLGQGIEVHDAPTTQGPVSFAVRWHGDRPALLWDAPAGVRVTAPGLDPTWSSTQPKGDALLAPVAPPGTPVSLRRG